MENIKEPVLLIKENLSKKIDNYNSEIELLNIRKKETLYVKQIRLINKEIKKYIRLRDLEQDKLDKIIEDENIS
jgi:hypothetical protein